MKFNVSAGMGGKYVPGTWNLKHLLKYSVEFDTFSGIL